MDVAYAVGFIELGFKVDLQSPEIGSCNLLQCTNVLSFEIDTGRAAS